MSKMVAVLVEGQTEESFVKNILSPKFYDYKIYFTPILLTTKQKIKEGKFFKGGGITYGKFRNDAERLLRNSYYHFVTTLFDYYGLSGDFPGMDSRPQGKGIQRVKHIESAVKSEFSSYKNFLPFFALHEFEAWLYCSDERLPGRMNVSGSKPAEEFKRICNDFSKNEKSPEDINERPDCAPSKRIEQLFPGYRKRVHSPMIIQDIGLNAIRQKCPHFNRKNSPDFSPG
jgi:hypothetical protein